MIIKLYEIVGRDYEGRLILFFRAHSVFVDKIKDEEKYIDYCIYMLDLFVEDHTEGYIDDFILLSDH